MSDLSADLLAVVAELDTSARSLDLVCGLSFKILGRQNALDRRLVEHEKTLERVMLLDQIVSRLAQRLRALENRPEPISPDEQIKETPLPPMRRNRRGRPKGALNRKTILKQRMAELSANRLGSAA
jgi:hypothetical protein